MSGRLTLLASWLGLFEKWRSCYEVRFGTKLPKPGSREVAKVCNNLGDPAGYTQDAVGGTLVSSYPGHATYGDNFTL